MTIGITLRNSDPSKCKASELLKVTNTKRTCNCYTGIIRPWMLKKLGVRQWRTEGGLGCSNPPPEIPKALQNRAKLLKIAEFRTPTPQDVRKKKQ